MAAAQIQRAERRALTEKLLCLDENHSDAASCRGLFAYSQAAEEAVGGEPSLGAYDALASHLGTREQAEGPK